MLIWTYHAKSCNSTVRRSNALPDTLWSQVAGGVGRFGVPRDLRICLQVHMVSYTALLIVTHVVRKFPGLMKPKGSSAHSQKISILSPFRHSTSSHLISVRPILIISSHPRLCLQSGSSFQVFGTKSCIFYYPTCMLHYPLTLPFLN